MEFNSGFKGLMHLHLFCMRNCDIPEYTV